MPFWVSLDYFSDLRTDTCLANAIGVATLSLLNER